MNPRHLVASLLLGCSSSPAPAPTVPASAAAPAPVRQVERCQPDRAARVGDLQIEYEAFGDAKAPPVLLVMGLGSQMVYWDEDFVRALAGRGFYVIRFDNRDVGRSTKISVFGEAQIKEAMTALFSGRMPTSPYQLRDMAGDAVGLLDALGIRAAHVVGASMGGMIAQEMAIRHPSRVLSLTSIMSTTGDPSLPRAAPQVVTQLFKPPPLEREPYVAHVVELFRVIGAGAMPFDEERTRRNAGRAWDRCLDPSGAARQMLAIVTSGSRKPELAHVKAPTVVIHGDADPLVPPAAGEDTARSIPGAKLVTIPGMGHALPEKAWPRIIDAIVDNAARAKP